MVMVLQELFFYSHIRIEQIKNIKNILGILYDTIKKIIYSSQIF